MYVTDPIADMLTRMRNAILVGHDKVKIPHSQLKEKIAKVLKNEGYIQEYKVYKKENRINIIVTLKYFLNSREHLAAKKQSVISGLVSVSTPGRRTYVPVKKIKKVLGGLGTAVITTPKGILTDKECRESRVGGELLFKIW